MLALVKSKLVSLISGGNNVDYLKSQLKDIVKSIDEYEKTEGTMTDMHSAFRALEDYNLLYHQNTEEYYQLPETTRTYGAVFKVHKILCINAMMSSIIEFVFRKYSVNKDSNTGTIAKYLRTLNEQKEHLKSEKIIWTSILKSLTTMMAEVTSENAITEKEIMLKIAEVDKGNK